VIRYHKQFHPVILVPHATQQASKPKALNALVAQASACDLVALISVTQALACDFFSPVIFHPHATQESNHR
jgi:hypothetical protein